tara:strand:+ start:509 stop:733 length:225 start_codon:yes stop_codon:yes gene_type:complete
MYYHNSSRNTILEEQTPMSFTMQLPTYQVETKSGSTLFPSHAEANNHYQKFVDKNIPCEFYEDGKLKKEHKPIT